MLIKFENKFDNFRFSSIFYFLIQILIKWEKKRSVRFFPNIDLLRIVSTFSSEYKRLIQIEHYSFFIFIDILIKISIKFEKKFDNFRFSTRKKFDSFRFSSIFYILIQLLIKIEKKIYQQKKIKLN